MYNWQSKAIKVFSRMLAPNRSKAIIFHQATIAFHKF